jgi:hypothetical protein
MNKNKKIAYLLVVETHLNKTAVALHIKLTWLISTFRQCNEMTCYKLTLTKNTKHFYGNKSHVQIGPMIKSKINTNKSQGNES